MPLNPYDDRKVSLQRSHGNSDLDIVRALYTRCKAIVTAALGHIQDISCYGGHLYLYIKISKSAEGC